MERIRQLIAIASRRLSIIDFLHGAHWALLALAALAVLLVVAGKISPSLAVPWSWTLGAMAIGVLLVGFFNARRRRPEALEVAVAVDLRLDLRERLSTALCCEGRDDPFAQAAVEDGVEIARRADMPRQVSRRFPIEPPRGWWLSPLVALAAVAFLALPQGDIFNRPTPEDDETLVTVRHEAREALERIVREIEENPSLRDAMADLVDELGAMDLDGDMMRTPEDLRREVIRRATEVNERLADIREGEKGMTEKALRDAMRGLEDPGDGPARDIVDAMRRGDFEAAKAGLERLMEDLQAGNLDEAQREALKDQLEALADQLDRLAERRDALEEALRRAGLDPQLANNPQALEQALRNDPNLNQQQREQLQKLAQAQQAACQMCENMGDAAAAMARAAAEGGDAMAQAGEGMQQLLGDAEMLQMMMMQAQAAMEMCQGQCQGLGQGLGLMPNGGLGGGMGGPGVGAGGEAPIAPTPTGRQLVKENVEVTDGDIIARQLVRGEQIVGESRSRLQRIVGEESAGFEESVDNERVAPQFRDAHKHYFGRLRKRIEEALEADGGGS